MKVTLAHCKNPDIKGGYWTAISRPRKFQIEVGPSYAEAVTICLAFIAEYDLGGGNWAGGQVYDDDGKQVARISYNGRLWRGAGYPEPEIDAFTGKLVSPCFPNPCPQATDSEVTA